MIRRASISSRNSRSRASRASLETASASFASQDNDGSSCRSFAAESRRSADSNRCSTREDESRVSYKSSHGQMLKGETELSSIAGSLGRGISKRGDRQKIQSRATVGDSFEEAAPLDPSLRVMSVVIEGSNVAFCCYNEDQNEIMTETCTANGYETQELVERFLQVARPNMVLVGNRIVNNIPLLDLVTRRPQSIASNGEEGGETSPSHSSIPYRLLKTKTYDVRSCKKIILQKLKVLSLLNKEAPDNMADKGKHDYYYDSNRHFPQTSASGNQVYRPSSFHSLAAVIDFESKVLVQAFGALLSYLQSTVFQLEEGNCITINRIVKAKISGYMSISQSTLSALHIFSTEKHPLIAKGHGRSKEGFSLYSLLDRTKSQGGRQMLREWMLRPLIDLDGIRTRQDATEFFLQPCMQTAIGFLLGFLPKIGSLDRILLRIQKCVTKPQDFLILTTTLSAAVSIASIVRNDILSLIESHSEVSTPLAQQFFSELYTQCNVKVMTNLRERIMAVIDIEAMMEGKGSSIVIRHGFHEQLDSWKEQYDSLEEILLGVGKDLYHKDGHLEGLSIVFIPQIGYLVELDQNQVSLARDALPPDFEHIFNQDNCIYFKCGEMRNLDEEIGDLDAFIKDTELMIMTQLEETILDTENELRECFKALSILDCVLSFANCAADLNFTRPQLIDDDEGESSNSQDQAPRKVLSIKDGRHPLQEIFCEREFVTNDVQMDNLNRILCVTGPNYSGKSCYMRQVGLLVYMAHLGSFIPCSKAVIPITDQIFARVSTTETCSRPQSSFQLELTEMASILLKATPKSLVLIDEFGKGTSPASGIAILGAAVKSLSKIQCKAVCTTHFLELFTMNVIADRQHGIRAARMAIHLPEGKEDSATPLFKLEDGIASSSAGLICAKNAGVDNDVINRAKEIIQTMRARKTIQPLPELAPQVSILSKSEKEILAHFTSVDSLENSSDDDITKLLQLVADQIPSLE